MSKLRKRPARGAISEHEFYPLSTFMARLGIGRSTLIAWRKAGLPICQEGRRIFIFGKDAHAFWNRIFKEADRA